MLKIVFRRLFSLSSFGKNQIPPFLAGSGASQNFAPLAFLLNSVTCQSHVLTV